MKGLTQRNYPKLEYLYIDGNQMTCKYISGLKFSFKYLKVIGDCNNQSEGENGHDNHTEVGDGGRITQTT